MKFGIKCEAGVEDCRGTGMRPTWPCAAVYALKLCDQCQSVAVAEYQAVAAHMEAVEGALGFAIWPYA